MERIRYFVGIAMIIVGPLGLLYWLIIHPWARWWRACGLIRTYLVILPGLSGLGVLLFHYREQLLGRDLGTNWSLMGVALVLCFPMTWLEIQYWRQMSVSILVGIPELSQRKGAQLREGIYGVVRHPRYLSAGIGLLAEALFVNYVGFYTFLLLVVPPGFVMLMLEERELVDRFGDAYRMYQRDVPCIFPRLRGERRVKNS
jgi:protein-S-isoprenylcysteine O-methyltransferase Ste14